MLKHIAMAVLALAMLAFWASAAPIGGENEALDYSCNSETNKCTCTSFNDCSRMLEDGRCASKGKCDVSKGIGSCTCDYAGPKTTAAAPGMGDSSMSYSCSSTPVGDMCTCDSWNDCHVMKENECKSDTFRCLPGTFLCSCSWKAASTGKSGDQTIGAAGSGVAAGVSDTAAPSRVSTGHQLTREGCDPSTEPALPPGAFAKPSKPRPGKEWMPGQNRCVRGQWEYVSPRWVTPRKP